MDNQSHDPTAHLLDAGLEGASPEKRHDSVFLLIHRRLRGRYKLVAVLAVALMIPGAWAGYKFKKLKYSSVGIVRVAPALDPVLYPIHEKQPVAWWGTMVATQASLVQSRRVFDRAVETPDLLDAGWPAGGEGVRALDDAISVDYGRGEELIHVRATTLNPVSAQKAVNAVLDAYYTFHGEEGKVSSTQTMNSLKQREADLRNRLGNVRKEKTALSAEYGGDMLESLHAQKVEEIESLDRKRAGIEQWIDQQATKARAREQGGDPVDSELLIEMVADSDELMAQLLLQRRRLEQDIEDSGNLGPNHRSMRALRDQLNNVNARIKVRLSELGTGADRSASSDPRQIAAIGLGGLTPDQLREQLEITNVRLLSLRGDAVSLAKKLGQIRDLEVEEEEIRGYLAETTRRYEQLIVETKNTSATRISIAQRGDLPLRPEDRRPAFAAIGGIFGASMGIGFVLLLSLFDRGYRYIDDLERDSLGAPLLGTLPDLTERSAQHDEMAALSVHHLRNMLHLQSMHTERRGRARVYTITSATSGDGKTSLALALGMSFAVSGQKTLLMDADLVGRGLSRELKMDRMPGLCQAVSGDNLNGEVHKSTVDNLWTLPAGVPDAVDAKNLSHAMMERIIKTLREDFDAVLIDTGPLLGSLEANLCAALSDGVVLTVARGQSHKFVQACVQRLQRMGAVCAGLVFNRAERHDFDHSVSAASFCSQSIRPNSPEDLARGRSRAARGALVRAVMASPTDTHGGNASS